MKTKTTTAVTVRRRESQLSREVQQKQIDVGKRLIEQFAHDAREAWADTRRCLWRMGKAINTMKAAWKMANGKVPKNDEIADFLGIGVTPQRIGQISNTAECFEGQFIDQSVDFRVYEEARKLNEKMPEPERETPAELARTVSLAMNVASLRELMDHKPYQHKESLTLKIIESSVNVGDTWSSGPDSIEYDRHATGKELQLWIAMLINSITASLKAIIPMLHRQSKEWADRKCGDHFERLDEEAETYLATIIEGTRETIVINAMINNGRKTTAEFDAFEKTLRSLLNLPKQPYDPKPTHPSITAILQSNDRPTEASE